MLQERGGGQIGGPSTFAGPKGTPTRTTTKQYQTTVASSGLAKVETMPKVALGKGMTTQDMREVTTDD